jgi:septum formation protein
MIIIQRLLLASSSPFRKKLLASTGVEFSVQAPEVDEYALKGANSAETCALRSRAKALAVASADPGALAIGCDQILDLAGQTFDKAKSAAEAAQRLTQFAGKTHHLINHITLTYHNQFDSSSKATILAQFSVSVPMTMRRLSAREISSYVDTGEWHGCVGCYQFENRGIHLFEDTKEDHSAIVGLPLQPLLHALRQIGINPLLAPKGPWTIL